LKRTVCGYRHKPGAIHARSRARTKPHRYRDRRTAGIGRAIANRFAREENRIGILARDTAALEEVAGELRAAGAEVAVEAVDVADAEAVFAAAERLEQKLGKIDLWINNAMETIFSTVADMTPQEFRRVTEVTYLGFVHGTMAALKSMRLRRRGHIIHIGSALAYRGIPLQSAYCGAKHAIRGFTDSLRAELIHEGSGVRLTMIDLPAVNTPQFDWARIHIGHTPRPMGTPIEPELVADAVFRVANGRWREYWLGIPTILTVLGDTIWPGLLERYLARKAIAGQQTATRANGRRDNLDAPVTELHRTRGSFSAEAGSMAPLVPAEVARVGAVALGAAVFFALGASLRLRHR
jgi:NAD(P)-dependent dehydrogenase (short-subunit alcohol dehydrogenase family)